MKVLVIGSGAREHAIAHALMRGSSVSEVTVAPGNPGMELDGIRITQISPSNHAALIDFVKNNGYDWVFVGPEVPMTLIMLHAKVTEDKKYAKLMAILTSVNGGIGGVDAILGGWLAGTFGFRSVFWVMVGVAVLAIVLVFVYAEAWTR